MKHAASHIAGLKYELFCYNKGGRGQFVQFDLETDDLLSEPGPCVCKHCGERLEFQQRIVVFEMGKVKK